jgi:hypothetical protein
MNDSKRIYRELCRTEPSIPVFSKDWWLDAACGVDGWDVAIVERKGGIVGTLPYPLATRLGFKIIRMPPLTQKLGPWLKYAPGASAYDRLTFEKEVMTELIERLPAYDSFSQQFDYTIQNWLPFYWKGFQQTTRYTYVIDDIRDLTKVVANFEHSKRKNVKRAEKTLHVDFDLTAGDFYRNHELTLGKQNAKISYREDLFLRLHAAARRNDAGTIICARDDAGAIHGAIFAIWDANSAFDLISTIDPDLRNSGSAALLVRELIRYLADKTTRFDFEGSMIEPVEESFRRFGAVQKPYFLVTKINSLAFRGLMEGARGVTHLRNRVSEIAPPLHEVVEKLRKAAGRVNFGKH